MQFMETYHLAKESKKEKPAYPGAGFSVSGKISSSVCSHDDIGGGVYFAFWRKDGLVGLEMQYGKKLKDGSHHIDLTLSILGQLF